MRIDVSCPMNRTGIYSTCMQTPDDTKPSGAGRTGRWKRTVHRFFLRWRRLRKADGFEEALMRAGRLTDPERDEDLIDWWVATPESGSIPEALASARERLDRRIATDPVRRRHRDRASARLDALNRASDARAHFQQLHPSDVPVDNPDPGRLKGRRIRVRIPVMRAAGMALVSVYLVTIAVTAMKTDSLDRAAQLSRADVEWIELGETTRGHGAAWSRDVRDAYRIALDQAERSMHGPWIPGRFNRDELRRARDQLENAIHRQSEREMAPSRAFLALGKLNLLLGDDVQARGALEVVCSRCGEVAREASELLGMMNRP